MKGSLEIIRREYGLQPELLKGENEHPVFNESGFADLGTYLGAISKIRCVVFSFYIC